ncbi:MAG: helicase-exonuclease AddAB subunit AddA [Lachnospiraceae bacterium]|nr:helicase-exonuclease AddAB subunit AddA [Lachnospiraceae bacterium]
MGNHWTKEQQQVIDLRDCNMLVSAAAGSGKTAVLVERIISRIMDERKPVDIDRLLVVTFTNAAAAEMRERVEAALEEKLEQLPDNTHLQRQLTLIHHAQITTIHSFCLEVIRNHFDRIRLDPGFRIGDEGELRLLRQDAMEKLLEEEYEKGEPEFTQFSETFAPGKNDRELEDVISRVYDFSMGYPWPEVWRSQCGKAYDVENEEQLYQTEWMKNLVRRLGRLTEDMTGQLKRALKLIREPDGPWMYEEALLQDLALLERLQGCRDYSSYSGVLAGMGAWPALSRKKDGKVSEQKRSLVKEMRDQVKKSLKEMKEEYFFEAPEQIISDMRENRDMVRELLRLTQRFQEAYEEAKAEKNLVDFNDLEHFALQILVKEEGRTVPTETALEYADYYQEVMIDEYQDSNLVQEILLSGVSRKNNRFMVGDVKQSIYRFRLARPELFMEKYRTYTPETGENRRIDLHKNFRSRSQVLESVNLIFRQIMQEAVGGVEYDDAAALYPGAQFEPGSREAFLTPELLLVEKPEAGKTFSDESGQTLLPTEEEEEQDLRRREAIAAAERILEIVGKETVWDPKEKRYRPARWSDIVVLLRTVSGWTEIFGEVFSDRGIPSYTGSDTGYFSALEVKTVLTFLRVLDNPRQDIPLAAALRSPIGGLSDEELAKLRIGSPDTDFYTCCVTYLDREPQQREPGLYDKLKRFWELCGRLRKLVPYTPMHLLLWKILDMTGYGDYAAAMPGGEKRRANLDMLVEKAVAYEATSYRGLFHFIRYIERLQKYQVDYGEASVTAEAEDAVRIMSIHKSKGLEFPIVLVCGLGKNFNRQDTRGSLVLHPELGLGCDYVDLSCRIRIPLLPKKIIAGQIREENLGEELRVLYVAMTRAKEKLILTGAVKSLENAGKKWSREISYTSLMSAACYLDWIMPALLRHEAAADFAQAYDLPQEGPLLRGEGGMKIRVVQEAGQRQKHLFRQAFIRQEKEALLKRAEKPEGEEPDEEIRAYFERISGETYPFQRNLSIPGKMTVSELKKAARQGDPAQAVPLYEEPVIVPLIPRFRKPEEEEGGAARGTVYHRFLENLDFTGKFNRNFIVSQLESMVNCGKILKNEAQWISVRKIQAFLASDTAARMQAAAVRGELYREQPFVLGVPANVIDREWDGREQVLIQGIMDAWFYENGEIVLMDYKTDFVPEGQAYRLADKYRIQLEFYRQALERLTGKRVKEKLIYSFCLGETVFL